MRRTLISLFLIALFASPSWAVTCSTSWARSKDWGSSEVLTEPDLEGEFDNTNILGGNCGSVLGTHDHDNAGTDKLNAHASVVALSIRAGLISTEAATSHQALVAQGDGTAGWVTAVITSGESQGDVLYFDGSVWAKLAAGTNNQVLETQGASANPQWVNPDAHSALTVTSFTAALIHTESATEGQALRVQGDGTAAWEDGTKVAIGEFTRDTTVASGTQTVTGVGFQPVGTIFHMAQSGASEASWGFDDGTNRKVLLIASNAATTYRNNGTNSIYDSQNVGSTDYKGIVQSFDSDGFTISWTKVGSPTGTITVTFYAFK